MKSFFVLVLVFFYSLGFSELFFIYFCPEMIKCRFFVETPYGVYRNASNMEYSHWLGYNKQIKFKINSQGMRSDEEFDYHKTPNTLRVVVLGDSQGMGWDVAVKDFFLTQTKDRLSSYGKKVEFLNFSVSGYGTADELMVLKHDAIQFQPDIVLLVWHFSDLDDNWINSFFTIQDGKLVEKAVNFLAKRNKIQIFCAKVPGYYWVASHSHLWNFCLRLLATASGIVKNFKNVCVPVAQMSEEKNVDIHEKEILSARIIEEMNRVCIEHQSRLCVIDIPYIQPGENRFELPQEKLRDIDVIRPQRLLEELEVKEPHHLTPRENIVIADYLVAYLLKIIDEKEKGK